MDDQSSSTAPWIAIIGDRIPGLAPQDAIGPALADSAAMLGIGTPAIQWVGTERLAEDRGESLAGASGIWCAPGSPFRSMEGAVEGIRWARESGIPFIGTCAGFQHGVIEYARNVLGRSAATHAEYGPAHAEDLFIDELLCSLVGQTLSIRLIDQWIRDIYGSPTATERYYCRFGLNPRWRAPLNEAGLVECGLDSTDDDVRILRLAGHPFYVLTLFVPQTSSEPGRPHPLINAFLAAAGGVMKSDW